MWTPLTLCRLHVSCFLNWGSGGWWSLIEIVPQRRREDHTPWATDETSTMSGLPLVLTAERSWVRHLLWFCPNPETTCVCPLSCSTPCSSLKSDTSATSNLTCVASEPTEIHPASRLLYLSLLTGIFFPRFSEMVPPPLLFSSLSSGIISSWRPFLTPL